MSRIMITGTSKGMGYDATLSFARAGHEVIATMRKPDASDLAEVAAKESLPVKIYGMDVDDNESIINVLDKAGQPDVLINNAGILSFDTIEDEPQERFEAVMNTNYFGVVRCCKAVIPHMRENKAGCIINIGSVAGNIATSPSAAYAASKFAIEAFSDVLAQEMLAFGVRVYLVKPGIISTSMTTTDFPEPKADSVYPMGRRVKALFKFAGQGEAPVSLVSEKLLSLVQGNDPQLRHPVGPDAENTLQYRANADDERFTSTWGAATDEEFLQKVQEDMMIDLGPFMK